MDSEETLAEGTVSMLFTDIENSTGHLRALRGAYGRLLTDHARHLRDTAARHGGREVDTQGDAFFLVFRRASQAVLAAVDLQRLTAEHAWPHNARLRVRAGVHAGPAVVDHGRYLGLEVHRAARICAAGRGGQTLLSAGTAALVADHLPAGVYLRDAGIVQLKGFPQSETLVQLAIDGLDSTFPRMQMGGRLANRAQSTTVLAEGALDQIAPDIELLLLGPLEARRGGNVLPLSAPTLRLLIAVLGLRQGEPLSTDALIDILWAGAPPPTAATMLQRRVRELRALLERDPHRPRVVTRHPSGYRLNLKRGSLDLDRFEERWMAGREALERADGDAAWSALRQALDVWRGRPLSEPGFAPLAVEATRLEEMRVGCAEDWIEAALASGRSAAVIGELQRLVLEYPLREKLHEQLMRALLQSGRRADALLAYDAARQELDSRFGLEPSPRLDAVRMQVLTDDRARAESEHRSRATTEPGMLLVVSGSNGEAERLMPLAERITAAGEGREILVTGVVQVPAGSDPTPALTDATRRLALLRGEMSTRGLAVRVAAFASTDPAPELLKLVDQQRADLILICGDPLPDDHASEWIQEVLREASADVAMHFAGLAPVAPDAPVMVPFGGSEHDWAAVELAALTAQVSSRRLILVGVDDPAASANSSRLLATASLVLQRIGNVIAEPVLVPPGVQSVLGIAHGAEVFAGVSDRFREQGLGEGRRALAGRPVGPTTFVRRGTRPGVLAPPGSITRFTWTLTSGGVNTD